MGFEALSRGACHVTFIENNRNVCAAIRKNSEHFNVQQQITLVTQDALVGLEMLIQRGEQFDIIYFDPPYNASFIAPVLHALDCSSLLASRGILLVEERQKWMQPLSFATLALISQRTFGDTVLREYVQADRISSL